ncbi:MAG: single-stranded DNA-binding protein [Synechococcus sp. cluster2_bin.44]|jgi:single-stranded DNA-binding protein|nr:single-stranded DNA-binding protein [Synechococcus sp. cluster2_bin.44]
MNQCVLEVEVIDAPTVRYTQDNQTPIAEMSVRFDALRDGDPPSELKVVGWGNLAQELQNRVQVGQRLLIEGRLRMNTVPRGDGMKEKRAEFTLARLHPIGASTTSSSTASSAPQGSQPPSGSARPERPTPIAAPAATPKPSEPEPASWNSAPLVPDTDDIPF